MPKQTMNRIEALWALFREWTSERRSKSALKRLRRACEALGLSDEETRYAERLADYRPSAESEVYAAFRD